MLRPALLQTAALRLLCGGLAAAAAAARLHRQSAHAPSRSLHMRSLSAPVSYGKFPWIIDAASRVCLPVRAQVITHGMPRNQPATQCTVAGEGASLDVCCRAHVSCLPGWTATTDQVSSLSTHAMHSKMHADTEHNSYDLMLGPLPARHCAHHTFLGLSFSFLRQQKLCQAETSHKRCWESVPLREAGCKRGDVFSPLCYFPPCYSVKL